MQRITVAAHSPVSRQRPCAKHTPPDTPCRSRAPIGLIGRKYRDAVPPPPGDPRKAFCEPQPEHTSPQADFAFGMTFFLCIRRRAGLLRESNRRCGRHMRSVRNPSEKLPILTFRRKFLRRMRPRTELLHLNREFTLFVPFCRFVNDMLHCASKKLLRAALGEIQLSGRMGKLLYLRR